MFSDLPGFIQTLGLAGIALVIFAESGLFFGFFLPGDSLVFTAGLLASQGYFPLPLLLVIMIVSAVVGDSVGYAFGKSVGPKLFTREESFFFKKSHLIAAQEFFAKHGPLSIVLARFIPAVRTFTPILAGVGVMQYPTFLFWNIFGGFLWAGGLGLLGYYLGTTVPDIDHYLFPIIGLIVFLSVLPPAISFMKQRFQGGSPEKPTDATE